MLCLCSAHNSKTIVAIYVKKISFELNEVSVIYSPIRSTKNESLDLSLTLKLR